MGNKRRSSVLFADLKSSDLLNSDRVFVNSRSEHSSPGLARAAAVRVLVVEDFKAFRQFICSTVGKRHDLKVIGELSNGVEAVEKAVELKPDLILMDIELPQLNGIEAARQICKLVPESKIIFLTQETSAEVVQEAMRLGAWGYVAKMKAASELINAIENVISRKRFVST